MPKIVRPLPEVTESITRPVVMEVIRRFFKTSGLSPDTQIVYAGNSQAISQIGSTLDDSHATFARLPHAQKVVLSVNEDFPESNILTTAVLRPEHPVYFADTALDVYMKPVYTRAEIRIGVSLKTQDRTSADKFFHALQNNISRGLAEQIFNVTYHIPIPLEFIVILSEIQRLKEKTSGYNEDIGTYIRRCMSPRFTSVVNQAGNHHTLVIRETQVCTMGYFDFGSRVTRATKDDAGGSYETSFDYIFSYDLCTSSVMQYPVMIHNEVLSDKYRGSEWVYDYRDSFTQASLSIDSFQAISDPIWVKLGGYDGLSVPFYDDWLPGYQTPSTKTLLRLLLATDITNKKAILNLEHLGDYTFKPEVIAYLKDDPMGIVGYKDSAFGIQLFEKELPIVYNQLSVASNLDITSDIDLSPRKMYHLVVYLNYDVHLLSPRAIRVLIRHGAFCLLYLKTLFPLIEEKGYLPKLNPDGTIRLDEFNKAANYVSEARIGQLSFNHYNFNLVGRFIITANKVTDDAIST